MSSSLANASASIFFPHVQAQRNVVQEQAFLMLQHGNVQYVSLN